MSGQAAFLYLFAYYLGSSVCGTLAGPAGSLSDWPAVTDLALALFLACGLLIAWLWHVSFLDEPAFPGRGRPWSADRAERGGGPGL